MSAVRSTGTVRFGSIAIEDWARGAHRARRPLRSAPGRETAQHHTHTRSGVCGPAAFRAHIRALWLTRRAAWDRHVKTTYVCQCRGLAHHCTVAEPKANAQVVSDHDASRAWSKRDHVKRSPRHTAMGSATWRIPSPFGSLFQLDFWAADVGEWQWNLRMVRTPADVVCRHTSWRKRHALVAEQLLQVQRPDQPARQAPRKEARR